MDIRLRPIYLIFALVVITATISGNDNKIIIDVEGEDVFPFNYKSKSNAQIQGYAYELVKALMDETKLENTITILPWSRVLNNAQTKKNKLIYPIVRTAEREKSFNWVGEVASLSYDLYCLSSKLSDAFIPTNEIKNIAIGVSRKGFRATYLKKLNFNNLVFTKGSKHTNKLLMRGRVDCIVASYWGISELNKEYEIKAQFLTKHAHFNIPKIPIFLALSLQTDTEIVTHIKKSYQRLVDNGTYKKIMNPVFDENKR